MWTKRPNILKALYQISPNRFEKFGLIWEVGERDAAASLSYVFYFLKERPELGNLRRKFYFLYRGPPFFRFRQTILE
jgi:hypothetical protein